MGGKVSGPSICGSAVIRASLQFVKRKDLALGMSERGTSAMGSLWRARGRDRREARPDCPLHCLVLEVG